MRLGIVYLGIGISLLLTACQQPKSSLALGTLERDRVLLKATAAEIITQLPHSQGQEVSVGDLLVQLDDRRQLAVVAKADANLAMALANQAKLQHGARHEDVAAARSQVAGAQAQWVEAQKAFERSASLINQKLTSAAQLDAARAKRDSTQATLNHANENLLSLTNGSRIEDLAQADAQVAMARAALSLEQQALADLSIRATRAGRLDVLPKHLGERVTPGETLAIILDNVAPYGRVYIPESVRVNMKAGQELVVHVDGVNEAQKGKLRWVAQDPAFTPYFALNSADRSRLVYVAEVQLPDTAKDFSSGVPVQVELPNG